MSRHPFWTPMEADELRGMNEVISGDPLAQRYRDLGMPPRFVSGIDEFVSAVGAGVPAHQLETRHAAVLAQVQNAPVFARWVLGSPDTAKRFYGDTLLCRYCRKRVASSQVDHWCPQTTQALHERLAQRRITPGMGRYFTMAWVGLIWTTGLANCQHAHQPRVQAKTNRVEGGWYGKYAAKARGLRAMHHWCSELEAKLHRFVLRRGATPPADWSGWRAMDWGARVFVLRTLYLDRDLVPGEVLDHHLALSDKEFTDEAPRLAEGTT